MSIEIEKGIPVPEQRGRKPHGTYSDIGKLEVGDSFVAKGDKFETLQSAVRQAARRAGIKITTRREEKDKDGNPIPEGQVWLRVWRIAPQESQE